jgi:hypothetical protein
MLAAPPGSVDTTLDLDEVDDPGAPDGKGARRCPPPRTSTRPASGAGPVLPEVLPGRRFLRGHDGDMAIVGAHALVYTSEPEAVREIFREVFGFEHVDAGHGWLIFGLPPAELGVHPGAGPTFDAGVRHELSFMCDDLEATIEELQAKGIEFRGEPQDEGYGTIITMVLPGGLDVLLYQPRHLTAI